MTCSTVELRPHVAPVPAATAVVALGDVSLNAFVYPNSAQGTALGTPAIVPGSVRVQFTGDNYTGVSNVVVSGQAYMPQYNPDTSVAVVRLRDVVTPLASCPLTLKLRADTQRVVLGYGTEYLLGYPSIAHSAYNVRSLLFTGFNTASVSTIDVRGGSRRLYLTGNDVAAVSPYAIGLRNRRVYITGISFASASAITMRTQQQWMRPTGVSLLNVSSPTIVNKRRVVYPSSTLSFISGTLKVELKRRYVGVLGLSATAFGTLTAVSTTRRVPMTGAASGNAFGTLYAWKYRSYALMAGTSMPYYGAITVTHRIRSVYPTSRASTAVVGSPTILAGHNVLQPLSVGSTTALSSVIVRNKRTYIYPVALDSFTSGSVTALLRNRKLLIPSVDALSVGVFQLRSRLYPAPSTIGDTHGIGAPVVGERVRRVTLPSIAVSLSFGVLTALNRSQFVRLSGIPSEVVTGVAQVARRVRHINVQGSVQLNFGALRCDNYTRNVHPLGTHTALFGQARVQYRVPHIAPSSVLFDAEIKPIGVSSWIKNYVESSAYSDFALFGVPYVDTTPKQPKYIDFTDGAISYPAAYSTTEYRHVFNPSSGVWQDVPYTVLNSRQDFAAATRYVYHGDVRYNTHTVTHALATQQIVIASLGDTSEVNGVSYPDPVFVGDDPNVNGDEFDQEVTFNSVVADESIASVAIAKPNLIEFLGQAHEAFGNTQVESTIRYIRPNTFAGFNQPVVNKWYEDHALRHPSTLINQYVYPECEWVDNNGVYRFEYWTPWRWVEDQVGYPSFVRKTARPVSVTSLTFGRVQIGRNPYECFMQGFDAATLQKNVFTSKGLVVRRSDILQAVYQDRTTPNTPTVGAPSIRYG